MRKCAEDIDVRIRHINLAIAYKRTKKASEMKSCLSACDWTASIRDFRLAVEVLNGNYTSAAEIMRQIGKAGEVVQQDSYHDWPLFYEFIGSEEFKLAYSEIYGHDFDAKRKDEPDAVTVDASSDNGALLTPSGDKATVASKLADGECVADKPKRQRKKKADV